MKRSSTSQHAVDHRLPAGRGADRLLQPREAEHLALRVVRLDDPVGVQQQAVAGREHDLVLLVLHPGQQAERHAAGAQLGDAVGGLDVREVVAGVREPEQPGARVEHGVQAGDEHLLRHVRAQVLVDPLEHLAGLDQPLHGRAQDAAGGGHHQRGRARPCR